MATNNTAKPGSSSRPPICKKGGRGLFLPAFRDAEQEWEDNIRGLLYGVALLYCFLGVSIVSDIFMSSIETMTSKKKRVKLKDSSRFITVYVWNSTVANLSLMALGSSAPEILLSVIELLADEMYSGELGPSTVVGSAAFNLLVIVAVCISAIPMGEVRYIESTMVYSTTAIWSLFAYAWLLIIVDGNTPGVIDVWEGLVTLAFFPVLVFNSYLVDRYENYKRGKEQEKNGGPDAETGIQEEIKEEVEEDTGNQDTMSRVHRHRSSGIRMLVAGHRKKGRPDVSSSFGDSDSALHSNKEPDNTIRFPSPIFVVDIRKSKTLTVPISRTGDMSQHATVKYETVDCVCRGDVDYVSKAGSLNFIPGDKEHSIDVQLLPSGREVGYFKVQLAEPSIVSSTMPGISSEMSVQYQRNMEGVRKSTTTQSLPSVALGKHNTAYVLVVNADLDGRHGVLTFGSDSLEVQGGTNKRKVRVPVFRVAGHEQAVMCSYRTERLSAVPGYDYEEDSGELYFADGQVVATIQITVLPKKLGESNDCFQIVLDQAQGGVLFNPHDDGGEDSCILTVTIVNENRRSYWRADTATFYILDKAFNVDFLREVAENWCDQIVCACFCNGSFEAQKTASVGDWTMHLALLPWKLFYSVCCPPPVAAVACFVLSLAHIGLVTAVVCDLAGLFGCVLGVEDSITAITFVALGTSLPDLFASRTAAVQDEYADASIVNVTGSNAVNVFLGVGLTWSMGAVYWGAKGGTSEWRRRYGHLGHPEGSFVVLGSNLTFSVIVFMLAACVCLLVLNARRRAFGGELGGPHGAKVFTAVLLVMLWIWYVSLSCWNATSQRSSSDQAVMILGASALLAGIILISGVGMNLVTALTVKNVGSTEDAGQASPMSSEAQRDHDSRSDETERLLKILPKLRQAGTIDSRSKSNVTDDTPVSASQVLAAVHEMRSDLARWASTLEKFENAVRQRVSIEEKQQSQMWSPAAGGSGQQFGMELPLQPTRVMSAAGTGQSASDRANPPFDPWGDALDQGQLIKAAKANDNGEVSELQLDDPKEEFDPDKVNADKK